MVDLTEGKEQYRLRFKAGPNSNLIGYGIDEAHQDDGIIHTEYNDEAGQINVEGRNGRSIINQHNSSVGFCTTVSGVNTRIFFDGEIPKTVVSGVENDCIINMINGIPYLIAPDGNCRIEITDPQRLQELKRLTSQIPIIGQARYSEYVEIYRTLQENVPSLPQNFIRLDISDSANFATHQNRPNIIMELLEKYKDRVPQSIMLGSGMQKENKKASLER